MRALFASATAIVLGLLTLGLPEDSPASGGATPGPPAARAPKLVWDHTGVDLKGAAVELDHAEIALTAADPTIVSPDRPIATIRAPVVKGTNETDLGPLLEGKAPGKYHVWARAVDKHGVPSGWAGPAEVTVGPVSSGATKVPVPASSEPGAASPKAGLTPEESAKATGAPAATKLPSGESPSVPDRSPDTPEPWSRPPPPRVSPGCLSG